MNSLGMCKVSSDDFPILVKDLFAVLIKSSLRPTGVCKDT